MDKYQVIVLAAGLGKRMKKGHNKQFIRFLDKPLIIHTLSVFESDPYCESILLVVNPAERYEMQKLIAQYEVKKASKLVDGGKERQNSVFNGLKALHNNDSVVLIHDGARPFVDHQSIHELVKTVKEKGAALLATPVNDTIKTNEYGQLRTLNRQYLYSAQTPQGFDYQLIMEAHDRAVEDEYIGTDDASLVERLGKGVQVVRGSYDNFKLTTPEDIKKAESLFLEKMNNREEGSFRMRIGTGYDVHQLVDNRPCIIGGVEIPYEKGLLGHSDADVLLHTVADACLGAIGEGDIGKHFPDTDPEFKDADSSKLLAHVWEIVTKRGYVLGNIDCTIIAQAPKMAPYVDQMKANIAHILHADLSQVNVKATTTEKLGFVGRKEGIAAEAVVLLQKNI
jgi:2-C-methyl-D-erythritol 4-phosphate cytidylyltransferase/2-C-methyl-D-erythritol 2,4-cyclodiphosphate synthase